MNETQFYNGVLFELNKTAALQPKKKSIFGSPAFWGGLGLAGLGGYGLYKAMGNSQTPPKPAVASTPAPAPAPTPAPTPTQGTNSNGSELYDNASSGAQTVAFGAPVVGGALAAYKIPAVRHALPVVGDVMFGADAIKDSIVNKDNLSMPVRATQATGGAAMTGLGLAGLTGKNLARTSALSKPWLPGQVAKPTSFARVGLTPILAGTAAAETINSASNAAENHANEFLSPGYKDPDGYYHPGETDKIIGMFKALRSNDPTIKQTARKSVLDYFNNFDSSRDITSPSGFQMMGYNPVPFGSSKLNPDFSSYHHILEKLRREALRTQ